MSNFDYLRVGSSSLSAEMLERYFTPLSTFRERFAQGQDVIPRSAHLKTYAAGRHLAIHAIIMEMLLCTA